MLDVTAVHAARPLGADAPPEDAAMSDWTKAEREKLPDSDFGWPEEKKYPVKTAKDFHDAWSLVGHAPEELQDRIRRRLIAIAKRKGFALFPAAEAWAKEHHLLAESQDDDADDDSLPEDDAQDTPDDEDDAPPPQRRRRRRARAAADAATNDGAEGDTTPAQTPRRLIEDLTAITLSEGKPPTWVHIFPEGTYRHPRGLLRFDPTFHRQLVEAINKRARTIDPVVDTDHDRGAANGWVKEARYIPGHGTDVRIAWTPRGIERILRGEYRYVSPDFGPFTDPATGKRWPVALNAVSLTNFPHLKNLPDIGALALNECIRVAAADNTDDSAGEAPMTTTTTLPNDAALPDDQYQLLKQAVHQQEEQVRQLRQLHQSTEEENRQLREMLARQERQLREMRLDARLRTLAEPARRAVTGDDGEHAALPTAALPAAALAELRQIVLDHPEVEEPLFHLMETLRTTGLVQLGELGHGGDGEVHDPFAPAPARDLNGEGHVRRAEEYARQTYHKALKELSEAERIACFEATAPRTHR